jgi:hypothetical protein
VNKQLHQQNQIIKSRKSLFRPTTIITNAVIATNKLKINLKREQLINHLLNLEIKEDLIPQVL